jgi:hypothetical protein
MHRGWLMQAGGPVGTARQQSLHDLKVLGLDDEKDACWLKGDVRKVRFPECETWQKRSQWCDESGITQMPVGITATSAWSVGYWSQNLPDKREWLLRCT